MSRIQLQGSLHICDLCGTQALNKKSWIFIQVRFAKQKENRGNPWSWQNRWEDLDVKAGNG